MVSIPVGEGLLLRSFREEDAPALFQAIDANRAHLRPWLNWVDATTKPEHSVKFIQDSHAQQHHQEGLALGIFLNDAIIGCIGMHHWEQNLKRSQMGYWIAKDQQGKGIMQSCCERFTGFLFERLGLNKIELHFVRDNTRSAALAKRLGYTVEGVIRQAYLRNGSFEDLVVSGLLRSEWLARKK